MGRKAIEIIKLDVKQLIATLNAALSEEWLAYYQYWIGAKLMQGPMHADIEEELITHANEELGHAELLANRIIQLGGTPVLSPAQWNELAACKYAAPVDRNVYAILKQNLGSERCAIQRYEDIATMTKEKDFVTFNIAISILKEELEHEEDIESWLQDIAIMKDCCNDPSCDCGCN